MKVIFVDQTDIMISHDFDRLMMAGATPHIADLTEPTESELVTACQASEVLVSSRIAITRTVLEQLPDLKMVCVPQVGFDHIDAEAAQDLGIQVGHSPFCNYTEVATHALAMVLMLIRQIPAYQKHTQTGGWDFAAAGPLLHPGSTTVGIIGLGRIGRAFAERARPCFGNLIGYDPYLNSATWPAGIERASSLAELLPKTNVISVHVPLTKITRNMIDAEFLAAMLPGSYLINTARGEVTDIEAVRAALDQGHIAGVGLDVLPQEAPCSNDPILTHPKAIVTPHSAFYSEQSRREKYSAVTDNVISLIKTGEPKFNALRPGRMSP